MEHNEFDYSLWSLPQEINELIFANLAIVDLLRLRFVAKAILTSLSNQRLWRVACISEFDLQFIDENSNWIELASKCGAINYNIRKGRVLVQALAVNRISSDRIYTGESFILDDNNIVVNWLRTTGRGSNAVDHNYQSAILNITTRKEVQSFQLGNDRSLVVLGNRLAELDWNGYSVQPFFNNIAMKDPDQLAQVPKSFEHRLPTQNARIVLANQDPTKKHLVVVVDTQTEGVITHVILNVYDLNDMRLVKSFSIKNFTRRGYFYGEPNVIFRGNSIYALSDSQVLNVFNLTSEHSEPDQIQLDIETSIVNLLGVHKSLVFGFCAIERQYSGVPWMYDLNSKTLRFYPEKLSNTSNMIVHCGVLVMVSGQLIRFIDYLSDPNQLKLISILQLDEVYRTSLQPMQDGKLFLSGYNSGAKLIDFEHATDNCEILFVTKTTHERKRKTISLKAYELVSRAKELLGTHEYVSRYFKMSATQRFGIMYLKHQNANSSLEVSLLNVNALSGKKPEYNTPYMYHTMLFDPSQHQEKQRVIWAVPTPVSKKFYGKVIIFYEELDGTRWKLSKPQHWITEKLT